MLRSYSDSYKKSCYDGFVLKRERGGERRQECYLTDDSVTFGYETG